MVQLPSRCPVVDPLVNVDGAVVDCLMMILQLMIHKSVSDDGPPLDGSIKILNN